MSKGAYIFLRGEGAQNPLGPENPRKITGFSDPGGVDAVASMDPIYTPLVLNIIL